MSTSQRRLRDREGLNQRTGTPATAPIATGDIGTIVGSLASEPSHDDIARRAYELYEARGCEDGHDEENWLQAERELRHGRAARKVIHSPLGK
jgi:hypothetical protein